MPGPADSDHRRARTPDAAFYGADAFARQREGVFPRSWQLAPLPRGGPAPEHAHPWTLLPGCLDEPLLWTADADGRPRCLSNVCTHRGRVLVEHPAQERAIRCPYHGRTFGLDGRLRSAPGFDDAPDFPRPEDHLPVVPSGDWHGFRFASLDPEVPFGDWIAPADELCGHLAPGLPAEPQEARDFEFDANWALYVDNYLEGLHVPFVHQGLVGALDWSEYRIDLFPRASVQVGLAAEGETGLELPRGHRYAGLRVAALWLWLYPNTLLNFYPWGLSINVVEPLGPARTRVRYRMHVARPELRERGAGADLERVEREDQREVVAVQRGLRGRLYRGGRYSGRHETAVHHFHRLLAAAVTRGAAEH